jgi:hypothetical protein
VPIDMLGIVVTIRCRMRWILLISVLSVIASGCAGGPTVPTTATAPTQAPTTATGPTPAPAQSTRGNLTMVYMILNDAGQGAHGDWRYKVTVHLSETRRGSDGGHKHSVSGSICLKHSGNRNFRSGSLRISKFQ